MRGKSQRDGPFLWRKLTPQDLAIVRGLGWMKCLKNEAGIFTLHNKTEKIYEVKIFI